MKKIYTHENRLLVFNARNLLHEQGIDCRIKNEYAGGGVGDLAPFETWPELWVDESQAKHAESILAALDQEEENEISCPQCGAINAANFRICWQCNSPLDSTR